MSYANVPRRDPEDLSALVRRGHASREDERNLRRAVERDAGVGVAHQVGLDFDSEGAAVYAGDEELILRAADAALSCASPRMAPPGAARRWRLPRLERWQQVAAIVALCSLCCSGVGAALWVAGVNPWQVFRAAPAAEPHVAAPARQKAVRARPKHVPQAVAAATPATEPALEAPALPAAEPARAPRARPSHEDSAAALFHAANSARRAGELVEARRLYGALIARAPDSDEAHVAHVSLAKLLLSAGQAKAAERAFQRYLVRGGGALGEEALFGRAESLARLGRSADEAAAWRALLAAYPDSVYAQRARERLDSERASAKATR